MHTSLLVFYCIIERLSKIRNLERFPLEEEDSMIESGKERKHIRLLSVHHEKDRTQFVVPLNLDIQFDLWHCAYSYPEEYKEFAQRPD